MEVIEIIENNDGSMTIQLEMTEEEKDKLLEYAVNNLLKDYVERLQNENNICPSISQQT